MTLRDLKTEDLSESLESHEEEIKKNEGWEIYYLAKELLKKESCPGVSEFVDDVSEFVDVPLCLPAIGLAVKTKSFEQGAERLAFRCTEVATKRGILTVIDGLVRRADLNGKVGFLEGRTAEGRVVDMKLSVRWCILVNLYL